MDRDPVVQEVRDNGAKLAEECDGDVHRMAERLRQAAKDGGREVITRKSSPERRKPPRPKPSR